MKIFFGAACAVVALSGCVAEQPATGQDLANIHASCRNYGFKQGTEQYTACVYDMDQRRISSNRDRRLRFANSMSMMGAGIQAQNNINAMSRPINTTCSRNGYYTNCTSY
ncbi:hypothetical protein ABVB72_02260 [Rhizobium nepotum]|uniref:hypothetical protein n=1 Tax=Rhizobium nepotum TaxID=1035271 RepID=UPI003369F82F